MTFRRFSRSIQKRSKGKKTMNNATVGDYLEFEFREAVPMKRARSSTKRKIVPRNPLMEELYVQPWTDFCADARAHADTLLREHAETPLNPTPNIPAYDYKYAFECNIGSLLTMSIGAMLRGIFPLFGQHYDLVDRSPYVALRPDFALVSYPNDGIDAQPSIRALVEVERPSDFPAPVDGDLVRVYESEQTELHQVSDNRAVESKVSLAINQLSAYLTVNHLRYGLLTTFNETYFFRRVSEHASEPSRSILQISPCIYAADASKNGNLSIVAAWFYLIHLTNQQHRYAMPYTPTLSRRLVFTGMDRYSERQIQLSELQFMEPSDIDGNVVLAAKIESLEICRVKLFDVVKVEASNQEYFAEISVYRQLDVLQGVVIPRFLGCFSANGMIRLIAMEPCGRPITAEEALTHAAVIRDYFDKIHNLGVVHGDVATRNILINDNGTIRIIDFGISTLRSSMSDQDWQALLDQEQMEIEELFIND